jgi:hypothetical protein
MTYTERYPYYRAKSQWAQEQMGYSAEKIEQHMREFDERNRLEKEPAPPEGWVRHLRSSQDAGRHSGFVLVAVTQRPIPFFHLGYFFLPLI